MKAPDYSRVVNQDEDKEGALFLSETLLPASRGRITASSTPMLQVVAPANLSEGYEFDATVGNHTYKVQVPLGGVEQGQTFSVPFPQQSLFAGVSIPVGHWRDGIFSCFQYGPCHPHIWTGLCCGLLAAGQVIRRLKLTAFGQPGSVGQTEMAFKYIFAAVVLYWSIYVGLFFCLVYLDPNEPGAYTAATYSTTYMAIAWIRSIWHYVYLLIMVVVLYNLRGYVRRKYAIPGSELEDCCCSFWCHCLVVTQMMRHTTDYNVYPSTCCTETGLPLHVPQIV